MSSTPPPMAGGGMGGEAGEGQHRYREREQQQQHWVRQGPNGTTTTTVTRNRRHRYYNEGEEEEVYGCGPGTLNDRYCCQPDGIVRLVEIVVCLVIISLVTSVYGPGPFKGVLFGQTILMIFDGLALCLTFIFLMVYFLNLHETHLNFWPWAQSDLLFSMVAAGSFLVLAIVEAYYSTGAWSNNCNQIGGDGVVHNGCRLIFEWAFASFFCFVNTIFYAFSAFLSRVRSSNEETAAMAIGER